MATTPQSGSIRFPERSTRIIPYLTVAQIKLANTLARRRKYTRQLEPAFVGSLGRGYYPILSYVVHPDEDFTRCEIAVTQGHTVTLDIDSTLFHTLDRAATSPATVPVIMEVTRN